MMDQSSAELIIRAIKQTLNQAKRYFEEQIGDSEQLIRRVQRFEVLLSGIEFQDLEYKQQLVNALHDITVELEATESDSESEDATESDSEQKTDTGASEETQLEIAVHKIYTGLLL